MGTRTHSSWNRWRSAALSGWLSFGCATALPPTPGEPYTQGHVVDAGDYTVLGPPGDGWRLTPCPEVRHGLRTRQDRLVGFARRRVGPDGSAALTMIGVGSNTNVLVGGPWPPSPGAAPTEEETARSYFARREGKVQRSAIELHGEVTDVRRASSPSMARSSIG